MKNPSIIRNLLILACVILFVSACTPGPTRPGREISFPDQGVSIKVADGWELHVESTDWTMWQRIEKGRGEEPWVFAPVTAINIAGGTQGEVERTMNWRFKGVSGVFDETVSPLTSSYPVPPGLWSLDPQKLDLIETQNHIFNWPGLSGIEPTVRLYENTHGTGETSALWHTYTVTFPYGQNTYEFVMSIPDGADMREWIDQFWASIEDVSITIPE